MGRKQTRTADDILQYGRDYYNKHKAERAHEYSLVSNRSRLRRRLKALGDDNMDKVKQIQEKIDAITKELNDIRDARWEQKRTEGKALFKKFPNDNHTNNTINETPVTI